MEAIFEFANYVGFVRLYPGYIENVVEGKADVIFLSQIVSFSYAKEGDADSAIIVSTTNGEDHELHADEQHDKLVAALKAIIVYSRELEKSSPENFYEQLQHTVAEIEMQDSLSQRQNRRPRYCTVCREPLIDGASFCVSCGQPLPT